MVVSKEGGRKSGARDVESVVEEDCTASSTKQSRSMITFGPRQTGGLFVLLMRIPSKAVGYGLNTTNADGLQEPAPRRDT